MRAALGNKKAELPYGSIVSITAKRKNVFMDTYTATPSSLQSKYNSRLLQNLGFRFTSKGWIRAVDPGSDEDPASRKGKRKVGSSSRRKAPPSRKSARLLRGLTNVDAIEESDSSESPSKTILLVELEDSLEISEGIGEQDPALAEKEDSLEYFAETSPTAHYKSVVASPIDHSSLVTVAPQNPKPVTLLLRPMCLLLLLTLHPLLLRILPLNSSLA